MIHPQFNLRMKTLMIMRETAERWFATSRGEGRIFVPQHKRRGARQLAENAWTRFENAVEEFRDWAVEIGYFRSLGPEIERQQYKRKPPKPDGFKEAA